MKRIFIVGTARSGTTLCQSLLANHPDLYTLPETHFLPYAIPTQSWLRPFRSIKEEQVNRVKDLLKEMNLPLEFEPQKSDWASPSAWTKCFLHFMDALAEAEGKAAWLEKTPMHLYYIDLIKKAAPESLFIHTIREPKANIAALFEVSKNHPTAFKQASLEKAIKRYKKELLISEKHLKDPKHFHLHYEDLVAHTQEKLKELQQFIGLNEVDLQRDFSQRAEELSLVNETWKANNKKEISLKSKLEDRLTPQELTKLDQALKGFQPTLRAFYED